MNTIFAFIIVLGILIFFHEFGHFIIAKLNKVGVLKFSLGFGPSIVKKRIGETEYALSVIPLGGYVKLLGENIEEDDELTHIDPKKSFAKKSLSSRAFIVAAGPIANLVLAFVIYTCLAWSGIPKLLPVVGEVQRSSPAYSAGISRGDTIVSINGKAIELWEDISPIIHHAYKQGKPLELTVKRGSRSLRITVVPQMKATRDIFGERITRPIIGISPMGRTKIQAYGPFEGIYWGITQSYNVLKITCIGFWKVLNGSIDIRKSLGGPIMIAQISGETFKEGWLPFLSMIAFISINLGLINLLPIPILDGGHLLLLCIEWITGKPVVGKPREIAQQIGIFILTLLTLLAFYNDIIRIFSKAKQ